MTFDALTRGCTTQERDQLAWFLAMYRARKTWEALRTPPFATIVRRSATPRTKHAAFRARAEGQVDE